MILRWWHNFRWTYRQSVNMMTSPTAYAEIVITSSETNIFASHSTAGKTTRYEPDDVGSVSNSAAQLRPNSPFVAQDDVSEPVDVGPVLSLSCPASYEYARARWVEHIGSETDDVGFDPLPMLHSSIRSGKARSPANNYDSCDICWHFKSDPWPWALMRCLPSRHTTH